jgi:hypothetical protein
MREFRGVKKWQILLGVLKRKLLKKKDLSPQRAFF